jgi:hypothetical protein
VLSALVATAHREDAQWGPLLLALLDESGLPREEIDPLMREFAAAELG